MVRSVVTFVVAAVALTLSSRAFAAGDGGAGDDAGGTPSPNGVACGAGSQCASGFCVEGVCCNSACNGTCQTCTAVNGSPTNGTCGNAKVGVDPHDDCPNQGAASCGTNGLCDGNGECERYADGTSCATTICAGNDVQSFACNGTGTCVSSSTSCGVFACVGGTCDVACATNADCATGSYCNGSTCAAQAANGAACTAASQCVSGQCTDGVCCNSACSGQCEACDGTGTAGTCVPVVGTPHGSRAACATGTASNPCAASMCDGITALSCEGFAGASVACGTATCADGTATSTGLCDGKGDCTLPPAVACGAYACGATSTRCNTTCASDADCASPAHCSTTGTCFYGATCDGNFTATSANGVSTNCSPYKCEANGACFAACGSDSDCISGYSCDPSGACVTGSGAGASSGGSGGSGGCALSEPSSGAASWLFAILVGGAATVRGRRRKGR